MEVISICHHSHPGVDHEHAETFITFLLYLRPLCVFVCVSEFVCVCVCVRVFCKGLDLCSAVMQVADAVMAAPACILHRDSPPSGDTHMKVLQRHVCRGTLQRV